MRGIALLWLRITVAVMFVKHAAAADSPLTALAFGVATLFILAGLFIPILSLASAALEIYAPVGWGAGWPLPFLIIGVLLALAALGPGAYSLDALFFGRKKLTIGRSSSQP